MNRILRFYYLNIYSFLLIFLSFVNKDEFRPETFKAFMQMPCGRLLTKAVLKDLGKKSEYKNLIKYKTPFLKSIKNNFVPEKTVIYINEEIK